MQTIHTTIWQEEAEPGNPFATQIARCHGYDVYGEMLGRARWSDMLFLLFTGQRPSEPQAGLLESLAVALANPGPRDASVHAAMCGGIGGSTSAACLTAALAVGAGLNGGSREIFLAMENWRLCARDLTHWAHRLADPPSTAASIWPVAEHAAGFDPHAVDTAVPVRQTLAVLAARSPGEHLPWLNEQRPVLERLAGHPLALPGVAAAAMADLGLAPEQGEMLYLLLRLPGAAAHALEQKRMSHRNFPFFALELADNTGGENS
jgi:citrate synthase